MFRNLFILGFALCVILPSPSFQAIIQNKIKTTGIEWVGPILNCPDESDPDFENCKANTLEDLKSLITDAVEQLNLDSPSHTLVEKYAYEKDLGSSVNFHLYTKNTKIENILKYKNLKLQVNTLQKIIRFVYEIPLLQIDSDYKLEANIISIPVKGSGPLHIDIFEPKIRGHATFLINENEDGEKVIQLKEPLIIDDMAIKAYAVKLRGLVGGNPFIDAMINYIGSNYGQEILKIVQPDVSPLVGSLLKDIVFNPLLKKVPSIAEHVLDL